ncbi:hypothetical protein [Stenotrophomonas cyclobalanopsidis]|uniref:hypothetical protein n=1 Tax=Stenotrophomonas cyclobalanopsidis TaxID=2771362 RepID=UPI0034606C0B
MAERIFNVYLYFDPDQRCDRVGYTAHEHDGDDDEGLEFLKKKVKADLQFATKVKLNKPFTKDEYHTHCRLGSDRCLYAEALNHAGAGDTPLIVATPVLGGRVTFNHSSRIGDFDVVDAAESAGEHGKMVDWLVKYRRDDGIEFSQLIHDDYFVAIKLLYNSGLYVSAMKLMLCCIDSLAYIEYGDVRGSPPFVRWLDDYADLSKLGVTAEELWELRNGLLHMSNINSSAVRNNRRRRISFRVGGAVATLPETGGVFYFDFRGLIDVFAHAQARWLSTYGNHREKFEKFVERYDETVSDGRLAVIKVAK